MLSLALGARVEDLLDALARDVAALRRRSGALLALDIAVPSPAMGTAVKQGLALRLGIFAHARVRSLRSLLSDRVAGARPVPPGGLALGLLDHLGSETLSEDPILAPVARYLEAPTPAARDLRRVQLADALGALFDDYLLHRPDWTARWQLGEVGLEADSAPWQAELLRRLLGGDRVRAFGPALEDLEPELRTAPLFVFGVPVTSPVIASTLERLGQEADVWMYGLSSTLEHWEDVDPSDPTAWVAWGGAERAALGVAAALAGDAIELPPEVIESTPRTILGALRDDIRRRRREGPSPPPPADESLVILAAPGVRRECESVAEALRARVEALDLRWSEVVIALGTPEADLYRSQLGAALTAIQVPFHELDVALSSDSRTLDAARLLLDLPRSEHTRQDVLRVLTHPSVRARHDIGDTDEWLAWMDDLAVLRGGDATANAETYVEKDLFHWDQGLRRLALGVFLAGPQLGAPDPLTLGEHTLLPADLPPQERARAGQFLRLARSLLDDARALELATHDLRTWAGRVRVLFETYLGSDDDDDERDLERLQSTLSELEEQPGETPVSFATVAAILDDRIQQLRTHRGQPLAEAVVIAPLREIAALPFRVAFLPGLGEGRFPASDRGRALDLRRGQPRRSGEITARERDEQAFLTRILATRDAVVLSWVARDAATGDSLLPSAPLAELVEILERSYLDGPFPFRELAWIRHETPGRNPVAHAERSAAQLGRALRAEHPQIGSLPSLEELLAALPEGRRHAVARRLGLFSYREEAPPSSPRAARVRLSHLRRFLEDPAQGWAGQILGMTSEEHEHETLLRSDEPFSLDPPESLELLREVFLGWLEAGEAPDTLESRYQDATERREWGGRFPTGVFGAALRHRHRVSLEGWRRRLLEATEGRPARLRRLDLGGPGDRRSVALPSLVLPRSIVSGVTEVVLQERGGSVVLVDRAVEDKVSLVRYTLRGWLTQLVAIASESAAPSTEWIAFLAASEAERVRRIALPPETVASARDRLDALAHGLLQGEHGVRFPLATQVAIWDAHHRGRGRRALEEILARGRPDPFGPLDTSRLAPPSVDEALDGVRRRLGPVLAALGEAGR